MPFDNEIRYCQVVRCPTQIELRIRRKWQFDIKICISTLWREIQQRKIIFHNRLLLFYNKINILHNVCLNVSEFVHKFGTVQNNWREIFVKVQYFRGGVGAKVSSTSDCTQNNIWKHYLHLFTIYIYWITVYENNIYVYIYI